MLEHIHLLIIVLVSGFHHLLESVVSLFFCANLILAIVQGL